MSGPTPHAAMQRLTAYFANLTEARVAEITQYYAADARFRDPFNDVRGVTEVSRVFSHMYEALHDPRFVIIETILEDNRAVIIWDFTFRIKRYKPRVTQHIHGLSVVRFDERGLVTDHRDYWDAASELYAKLPLIGPVMRFLARKMG